MVDFPVHFPRESCPFEVRQAHGTLTEAMDIKSILQRAFISTYAGMQGRRGIGGIALPWSTPVTREHIIDSIYPEQNACATYAARLKAYSGPESDLLYLVAHPTARQTSVGIGKFDLKQASIDELDVRPEQQGRGYGRAIFYLGLAAIKERHAENTPVKLHVVEKNRRAYEWYNRLGFCRAKGEKVEEVRLFRRGPLLRWVSMTAITGEVMHNLCRNHPWLEETAQK